MSECLVRADRVSKTFHAGLQEIVAVQDVSCIIGRDARIALSGPSGSGKSTLLQLLGGLDAQTSGIIEWPAFGEPSRLRPQHIAFVFQNQTLLPALNVRENIEVPLLLQGVAEKEARTRALGALERLNLVELAEKLPEELSGGQAQRVSFARALVGRPDLVLADEPTGQLDQQTADQLFDVVIAWATEMGTALLIATHDRSVAERMHERWAMRFGVLETSP